MSRIVWVEIALQEKGVIDTGYTRIIKQSIVEYHLHPTLMNNTTLKQKSVKCSNR